MDTETEQGASQEDPDVQEFRGSLSVRGDTHRYQLLEAFRGAGGSRRP